MYLHWFNTTAWIYMDSLARTIYNQFSFQNPLETQ